MLDVSVIETTGLGDRRYLVSDGEVAVAIDPQGDIDRVLELAGDLRITHVLETRGKASPSTVASSGGTSSGRCALSLDRLCFPPLSVASPSRDSNGWPPQSVPA
jgi:hypothetical protein